VFGRVLEGMDVVQAIEAVGSDTGQPRGQACITKCGVIE
jgi:cyclophilin family peptidyl-prolyl cis-trans isomerase